MGSMSALGSGSFGSSGLVDRYLLGFDSENSGSEGVYRLANYVRVCIVGIRPAEMI